MERINSLEQNFEVLLRKMVDLKHIKHQVATRVGRIMDGWLEKVEVRERELDEIRKEFEILRRQSYDDLVDTLSQKVIENLKVINLLRDECNASLESSPVHPNKMEHKTFSHEDLIMFTSNFNEKVGSGGFSNVYKGQLDDGKQVAVKVLKNTFVIGNFMAEMQTMVTASHPNLVTFYGFCFDYNMKALVYEFMKNGSLDKILFDNHPNLEWGKLYGIALETAKGLAYLHDGCGKQIIHRDMKPANILLDENLSPKITDFGVAEIFGMAENHYTIHENQGTHGYIAPEFRDPTSKITKKCDVYSFGVTSFEVLGKQKNGTFGPNWFPLQIWKMFEKGQLDELIESLGIPETHRGKAKILSMVAFWCIQYTVEIRPSMSTVVEILEKEISVNTPPYPFKFYKPPMDFSMLPSQETILEIHSESLAPDVFIKAFDEEEKDSDDEQALSYISDEVLSEGSKTSSETQKLLSELMIGQLQRFSRSDIVSFSSNFSYKIGIGGFSDFYKGQILDGAEVAIKVLKDGNFRDEIFMKSVKIMGPVYHPNIVKLHGYCLDANLKALVYEYVKNGSLDRILYTNHLHIEWEQLYEIVIETAKGLSAFHTVGIIHHDIKASNILLNSNFTPKINCSGLERFLEGDDDMHVTLTQFRGTSGYTAPEKWMPTSVVTSKSDVYSFGMLLFEVLGRRSNGLGQEWFPNQVWKMFNKGQLSKMIEDCGINKKDREKAYNLSMVAFWCAQLDPKKRPSMSKVVNMLEMEIPVMDPPNPFPFGDYSTSSSPEGSPRFNQEACPSIELSFHETGYALTDSDDDRGWDEGRELESMFNSFEVKCPPGGENSVVLYTRTVGSMGRLRGCNVVRSILKLHQVEIFERDLSTNLVYSAELRKLLESTEVPALFVHGRFIGGVLEVKSLDEEGKLKMLLHGIPVERP